MESFTAVEIGKQVLLPLSKVTDAHSGHDWDLGAFYRTSTEDKCEDRYQQIYSGMSLAPPASNITVGSVIVTSDAEKQKFAAVELQINRTVCDVHHVWETSNEGVFYLISNDTSKR